MAHLEWIESYSVGIKEMDNHHKSLIGIINDLHSSSSAGVGSEILSKVLLKLFNYTKYHFFEEEGLMIKYNYLGLKDHHNEHEKFIDRVFELQQKFDERKGDLVILLKIQDLLNYWWINHITGLDKKYGIYLNKKGIV